MQAYVLPLFFWMHRLALTFASQTLRCADFYSGCGGLSFLDKRTENVHISTCWAIDFCESMTLSFRANYPDTKVVRLELYNSLAQISPTSSVM